MDNRNGGSIGQPSMKARKEARPPSGGEVSAASSVQRRYAVRLEDGLSFDRVVAICV